MVLRPLKMAAKTAFAAADVLFPPLEGPRILLYHQVESNLGREMEVSLETFRRQVDWLTSRGEIVSLEDALARRGEPASDGLFVLTFDDGYADVYEHAYPLLRQRGLPFTIYLTTHPVESGEPLAPGATPLMWVQLAEMLESGLLTVGAHTHRHVDLRSLRAKEVEEELATSDDLIEERLGIRPLHFAYPWGFWSESAERQVADRYQTAALAAVGSLLPSTAAARLPRIPIQNSDGSWFVRRKARSGMYFEAVVRRWIRGHDRPPRVSEGI